MLSGVIRMFFLPLADPYVSSPAGGSLPRYFFTSFKGILDITRTFKVKVVLFMDKNITSLGLEITDITINVGVLKMAVKQDMSLAIAN